MSESPTDPGAFSLSSVYQQLSELSPATVATVAAAAAALAFAMSTRSRSGQAIQSEVDLNNQSVIIDGKPEHRGSCQSDPPGNLKFKRIYPECHTVFDALLRGKKVSNNGPCLGARTGPNKEYEWISYGQVIDSVHCIGSGLVHKGITPSNDSFVGIFSSNRIEWTLMDYACQGYSMCPVPLYDTLGQDSIQYVLNKCEIKIILVDTDSRIASVLAIKDEVPSLQIIITVAQCTDDVKASAAAKGVEIISFNELEELGKANLRDFAPAKPTDIFSICNTSGTQGQPKSAMLTHNAFLLMTESIILSMKSQWEMTPDDVHLSYLPLAHNFDRACHVFCFLSGAQVGYYNGDPLLLMDDLATLKPTFFASVPRLLNRIYDTVHNSVKSSKIKSMMLRWAIASKSKEIQQGIIRKDSLWDKLVFSKVQAKLGGRVRLVVSGSAPLSVDVMTFLRCAMGCPVLEGYGQTECGAGMTFTLIGDASTGGVGPPLPGYQVKLVDVPEMEFYAKDNFGEVCCKSETLLSCYYKMPEKTAEAIDSDGWLHTGDIGTWLPNGTLKIVDRKKHIFKLSQGEYIIPEKIETIYMGSSFVAQCFVNGNSLKPCLLAIIVPDVQYIAKWAPSVGLPTDLKEFCSHEKAKEHVIKDLLACGKKGDLKGFEQVKDVVLEPEAFSIANGLLTPTMKNKRNVLAKQYDEQMKHLYDRLGV